MTDKVLFEIEDSYRSPLLALPETGMGYQLAEGRIDREQSSHVAVLSARYVLPYHHKRYYSLVDLARGVPVPSRNALGAFVLVPVGRPPSRISLPPGYVPTYGAVALLGTHTITTTESYFRFSWLSHDPRYSGGALSAGTYLTSANDQSFVNTGFGAVGRYALPIPVPAVFVFHYQLSAGTISVGTVAPAFGQAGGGVEVRLGGSQAATPVIAPGASPISEF